jgi:RHS repeat-associated protein
MTGLVHPSGARVGRSYDAIDQTRHITVRGSATGTVRDTEYVYDDANRLSQVRDPLGGVTTYAYDDDSRLTSRTLPNGVVTSWTYNARGWVMSVTHRRADTSVIASRTYERSPSGEPTRITNHDGSYVLIAYDDALRVQSEAYRDAGGGVLDNIEYTYDLDGNRTTRRRGATITTSTLEEYTYAAGDELTTVRVGGTATQTWEHDFAGRTTRITRSGRDQRLAYDADDHITSIVDGAAETRWQFDAENRRTRREDLSGGITDSAHRYVQGPTTDASLDSAHMVTTDTGAEELAYVFAPIPGGAEHPLFRYDPTTGEAVYYLQDSMGSVIGLVDQTTTQTATFEYDGFGGERASTGTLAGLPVASRGDYRFHGMWLDSSVGLYYVRARVYDAGVGRFLSNDPAEGRRAQPESFEGSRFVHGNPFAGRDPVGTITMGEVGATLVSYTILAMNITAVVNGFLAAWRSYQTGTITWQDALTIGVGVIALAFMAAPFLLGASASAPPPPPAAGVSLGETLFSSTGGTTGAIAENAIVVEGSSVTFENFTIYSTARGMDLVGPARQILAFARQWNAGTIFFRGTFSNPGLAARFGLAVGDAFEFQCPATLEGLLGLMRRVT